MTISAKRLLDQPIISPKMDQRMGHNINGPSLIRVPGWLPNPLGKYYLYFAHHKGGYIRLAFADALTGPWKVYTPGTLDVSESLFEKKNPPAPAPEDRAEWSNKLEEDFLYAHVASPDVHIDHDNKKIRMYYHGLLRNGDQQSRMATSSDGIAFDPAEPLLGLPYFRVFQYQQYVYALAWGGALFRATNWGGPFETGPRVIPDQPAAGTFHGFRHGAVHRVGDQLYVFYSRIGDRPERILYVTIQLDADWNSWRASAPSELLGPELNWEGTDCPLAVSTVGEAENRVRELRDPCVFEDVDTALYLLYTGAGESAIGVARLEGI
jgi:hypothetical protein